MKQFLLILLPLLLLASCSSTIYLVRHAEKAEPNATMSTDVDLSEKGYQRAESLQEKLKEKNIQAVYSTAYKRTLSTAKPTAVSHLVEITQYNNGDSLIQVLVHQKNRTSLVVGHSNTVPKMLRSVGLKPSFEGNIPDSVYNSFFTVRVKWFPGYRVRLEETNY